MAGGTILAINRETSNNEATQTNYLVGNPEITFFKKVFKRYSNFSIVSIEQSFTNGTFDFGVENLTSTISKSGDLIYRMYMTCELPALNSDICTFAGTPTKLSWVDAVGYLLIKNASVTIGGTEIDKHYGTFLDVWSELSEPTKDKLWKGILKKENPTSIDTYDASNTKREELYIPFNFWFNKNPGSALPLVSLQYNDVTFKITTRNLNELLISDDTRSSESGSIVNPKLYVDYVYLDTNERNRFVSGNHDYLIEQLQRNTATLSTGNNLINLSFNHPVKELIFTAINSNRETQSGNSNIPSYTTHSPNNWNLYGSYSTSNPLNLVNPYDFFETLDIKFNGNSIMSSERNPYYYRKVQPIQYHSRFPDNYIYVYSFSLNPEEYQPSGACNFSRRFTAQLSFTGVPSQTNGTLKLTVYAINYNILRIRNGLGGLLYTN